jgi:hypothetical protein
MQIDFDYAFFGGDTIFSLGSGRAYGFEIAQPMQLVGEILDPQTRAEVEKKTIGINFRRENPLAPFKFFGDLVLQPL